MISVYVIILGESSQKTAKIERFRHTSTLFLISDDIEGILLQFINGTG